ncbi:MAG: DUF342 domain-containing protein [Desulfobacteraceae bacterium]|nr:MAG: DUF342 domain-containing protein [Desulfobacteraceae bacterium]
MTEEISHHIFLIESNAGLQDRIERLITQLPGYTVSAFSTASDALAALKETRGKGVSLIISSYRMPKMPGDEVLQNAREISGKSERMLISDVSDINTVISAVNTADIHACLLLPFSDTDLIQQVQNACRRYRSMTKQENLTRVTQRQNRQLFKLANALKAIDEKEVSDIANRKTVIKRLNTKLQALVDAEPQSFISSVEDFLEKAGAKLDPQGLLDQWEKLEAWLYPMFSKWVDDPNDPLIKTGYSQIASSSTIDPDAKKCAAELLLPLLEICCSGYPDLAVPDETVSVKGKGFLEEHLELSLNQDRTMAHVTPKVALPEIVTVDHVKDYLGKNYIISGVCDDQKLSAFLGRARSEKGVGEPFVIAEGKPPKLPQDAKIRYHFQRDYQKAGRIRDDGTIDFTDRGDIPFVKSGTLLAQKVFPIAGEPGVSVTGEEIPVPDPQDMAFAAGAGAQMSEDGSTIHAQSDGQPHLDALGNISVFEELKITGDIGFETGNIDFKGNLVVTGTVKEGFSVRAASLTCQQVEGAEVILTGDLHCSDGIVDATLVNVQGIIQAKYINNSKIESFGDLIVQKEIIDSDIQISGELKNSSGTILSSQISSKMGIEGGRIGTDVAKESRLTVGVDTYVKQLLTKAEKDLDQVFKQMARLGGAVSELDGSTQKLHEQISTFAQTQDLAQQELESYLEKKEEMLTTGHENIPQEMASKIGSLENRILKTKEEIELEFERLDEIGEQMAEKKEQVRALESSVVTLESHKNKLLELARKKPSVPRVTVSQKIYPGTLIFGPNSSLKLKEIQHRCRIEEIKHQGDDLAAYEMQVIQL